MPIGEWAFFISTPIHQRITEESVVFPKNMAQSDPMPKTGFIEIQSPYLLCLRIPKVKIPEKWGLFSD